jgi:hypothetical protein
VTPGVWDAGNGLVLNVAHVAHLYHVVLSIFVIYFLIRLSFSSFDCIILVEVQAILSFLLTSIHSLSCAGHQLSLFNMHSSSLYSAAVLSFAALVSGHGVILGAQGEKGSPASVGFQGMLIYQMV